MAVKQTAGRDQLGDFAPQFAQLNDDVLFGEVWSREDELGLQDALHHHRDLPREQGTRRHVVPVPSGKRQGQRRMQQHCP